MEESPEARADRALHSFIDRTAQITNLLDFVVKAGYLDANWGGKRVAELGCGSGAGLRAIHLLGAEVAGVDLQKYPHISFYQKHPLVKDLDYFEGTVLEFLRNHRDESFDVICAFNDESDVWSPAVSDEAYRTLKKGGAAIVTWQYINLSTADTSWPQGWPTWPEERKIIKLDEIPVVDVFAMIGSKI